MIVDLKPFPILFYIFLLAILGYVVLPSYRVLLHQIRQWMDKQNENLLGLIFAILCGVLAMIAITGGHNYGDDYTAYIAQAMALSDGNLQTWYENNHWIISHSIAGLGPDVYPWGFPLMLIPLYKLFGVNFLAFKCLIGLCFVLATFYIYKLYAAHISQSMAVILMLISGLNRAINKAVDEVTSNIPSLFFTFLTIYVIDRYVRLGKRNTKNAILIGLLCFFLVELRQANITILLALFIVDLLYLFQLLKKRKSLTKEAFGKEIRIGVTPYVVFLVGFVLFRLLFLNAGNTYGSYYNFSLSFMIRNCIYYYMAIGIYLCDFFQAYSISRFVVHALSLFALFITGIGAFKRFKKDQYLIAFVFVNIVMLLPFEGYLASAYMYPIFPICVLFGYYGCQEIQSWVSKGIFLKGLKAIVSALLVALCIYDLYVAYEVRSGEYALNEAFSKEALDAYDYINENITDDKIIVFFKPRLLYFVTGNKSYNCYISEEAMQQANYVFVSSAQEDYNDMLDYLHNHSYNTIYQNTIFSLWQPAQ